MPSLIRRCLLLCLLVVPLSVPALADVFPPEQRFAGMLVDGSLVFIDKPTEWADEAVQPKFSSRPIMDAERTFRWVINQSVAVAPAPIASIEFFGGDRLPGVVTDYEPATSDSFENIGECLVVEPIVSVDLPNVAPSGLVRVSTEWLRRIVWEHVPGTPRDYRPGTAFLRDGSQIKFKAVRWSKGAVSVLTDDGVRSLLMAQLAELHLPQRNSWDVWFEQLAILSPDLTARLMQVETGDGLRLTSSTLRYQPQFVGDRNKPEDWYPLFQPAWSLDPLVVPFRGIRAWRFFAPIEPPATLFDVAGTRGKTIFSGGWDWQLDRSVQSESLRSNKLLFGWGFGVHAPTNLDLQLHPVVTGFRVQSGLDPVVRSGGCVRSVVAYSNSVFSPLHRSEIMIGSEKLTDSSWLNVASQADTSVTLRLFADPVIDERPSGADPFDVRDCLNWLEPQWRLDPAKLKAEVTARLARRVPALRDWAMTELPATPGQPHRSPVNLTSVWDTSIPADPHYRLDVEPTDKFVVLTRKLDVSDTHRWLALVVTREAGNKTTPVRVQVRANGVSLGEAMVPERAGRAEPDPILIPLMTVRGKSVEVSVTLIAEGDKSRVEWRGSKLLTHHPGLVRLFDDEADFIEQLSEGEGTASISTTEKQLGEASLKITIGERTQARLKDVSFPIRETPRLGEFRFFRFAWKKSGGTAIGLQVGHDGELGVRFNDQGGARRAHPVMEQHLRFRRMDAPNNRGAQFGYQYDIGKDGNPPQPVLRLSKAISANWEAHTRDVYAEFGNFQFTGLGFQCPDGNAAYFDGLYLARSQADFQWANEWTTIVSPIAAAPNPDSKVVAEVTKAWEFSSLLSKVAPQFTTDVAFDGVRLLKDFAGKDAVRVHPPIQGKPSILRAPAIIPVGQQTMLKISCARHPEADWQLAVVVGGQDLLRVMVDANTAKDGWVNHEVDLSRFAGKNVVVEVHNNPTGWHHEEAYWGSVRIETR